MTQLKFEGKNLYIIHNIPHSFCEMELKDQELLIKNEQVDARISLEEVFAVLYCKSLKNITFIVKNTEAYRVTLLLEKRDDISRVLKLLKKAIINLKISEQNEKINGYAAALVEKLREGITTEVIDTKEQEAIRYCPECGMQCDSNIPYCMECGATV